MTQISIEQAQADLASAIERALQGEEVLITREGRPVVRLMPASGHGKRTPGSMKGKIWMSDDFDEPLDDFKDYM